MYDLNALVQPAIDHYLEHVGKSILDIDVEVATDALTRELQSEVLNLLPKYVYSLLLLRKAQAAAPRPPASPKLQEINARIVVGGDDADQWAGLLRGYYQAGNDPAGA